MDDDISIEDDEPHRASDSRNSSDAKAGFVKKINNTRRFDIKQLKAEIWKILEPRVPSYYRSVANR